MNSKKISLAILSCLLLMNNFQVSGSSAKKNNNGGMGIKTVLTAGLILMGISLDTTKAEAEDLFGLCTREKIGVWFHGKDNYDYEPCLYTIVDYAEDIESCLQSGGSSKCLDLTYYHYRSGKSEEKVWQAERDLKKETKDCMIQNEVIEHQESSLVDLFFGRIPSTCDMRQKECKNRFEQVEKQCIRHALGGKFEHDRLIRAERARLYKLRLEEKDRLEKLGRQWNHYTDTFFKEIKPCLVSDGSLDCLNVGQRTSEIEERVAQVQADLKKEAEVCLQEADFECQSGQKECEKKRKLGEKLCARHVAAIKFKESASKHGYQYKR